MYFKFFFFFCFLSLNIFADTNKNKLCIWEKNGVKLIFLGAMHHSDIKSLLHKEVENIFRMQHIDLYFMEGFSSDVEGISSKRVVEKAKFACGTGKCGENLYAAKLAFDRNIPIIGVDSNESTYVRLLKEKGFTLEDLAFFMLIRHIPLFHRDGAFEGSGIKVNETNYEIHFQKLLTDSISFWLNTKISLTVADFKKWYFKHFHKNFCFKDINLKNGDYYTSALSLTEDSLITQKIGFYINRFRDDFLLKKIEEALKSHKTLFVLFGRSHLDALMPALLKKLGESNLKKSF